MSKSQDHKRIGRLLILGGAGWAVVVAAVGALLAIERIDTTSLIINPLSRLQLFSVFRIGMVLGVMAPIMFGVLLVVVPTQIGLSRINFPRGTSFGANTWLFGAIVVAISYIGNGGPGGGSARMVDLFLIGLGLTIAGLLVVSVSLATTILVTPRSSFHLSKATVLVWSGLVSSVALILTLPVLGGTLIYLAVDHRFERVAFGATDGIYGWIGWAFMAPQIVLFAVPAIGILAQVVDSMTKLPNSVRLGLLVAVGFMSTAMIGSVTQSQFSVEFGNGASQLVKDLAPYLLFTKLPTLSVLIAIGLCLFAIRNSRPKLEAAFVPVFLGAGMVLSGLIGNSLLLVKNFNLEQTVFEEAVVIYFAYGVGLSAIGALAHYSSKIWGVTIPSNKVVMVGLAGGLATVLAALPYYIAGFAGQPGDVVDGFEYSTLAWLWNLVSTTGHLLALVVVIVFGWLLFEETRRTAATI